METKKILTVVYLQTPFSAYAGYTEEKPDIDSVGYSLEEVKREINSKLEQWQIQTNTAYQIKEVHRNF